MARPRTVGVTSSDEPSDGRAPARRRTLIRTILLGPAVLVVLVAGASAVTALSARGDLDAARADLLAGRAALLRPDAAGAEQAFTRADATLARAEQRLGSWLARPGTVLPIVRQNLQVGTALALSGRQVAAAGHEAVALLGSFPAEGGRPVPVWRDGSIDLTPFLRADDIAPGIRQRLARAERLLASSSTSLLAPQVRRARADALRTIVEAREKADVAVAVSFLLPRILGADGPRSWIVGAENLGELRGRGGYIGSMGVLEADHGRLRMGPFSATTDLPALTYSPDAPLPAEYRDHYAKLGALNSWPNLTMSPHFASGASVLLDRLDAAGGPSAGGIIATDPRALSYLLEVTGPVVVDGLPQAITADNVVEWSLNRAYFEFSEEGARKQVLGQIAEAVWRRVTEGRDLDGRRFAAAIGRSLVERHAVLYSRNPEEQAVIERAGVGGGVTTGAGDYLLVLGQNLGENKMDYYMERQVAYRGEVRPDGSVDSLVTVVVRNVADPGAALPDYIGGARPDLALGAGSARTYLSVFVPKQAVLVEFRKEDEPSQAFENRAELGKRLFGTYLDIEPGGEREVSFRYRVPSIAASRRYSLTLQNQATVRPDAWSVDVTMPSGGDGDALRWAGPLVGDRRIGG